MHSMWQPWLELTAGPLTIFSYLKKYTAVIREWYRAEIAKCTYRQYTTGFYFGKTDENTQIYDNSTYINEYIYLGIVEELSAETGLVRIEQRNKFSVGDEIEIMKPDGQNAAVKVTAMYDETGDSIESCPHARQTVWVKLSQPAKQYAVLRMRKNSSPS